jgi:putative spermidine/putrescine transport system permease protein
MAPRASPAPPLIAVHSSIRYLLKSGGQPRTQALAVSAIFVLIFFLLPIVRLVVSALSTGDSVAPIWSATLMSFYGPVLLRTLLIAAIVAIFSAIAGCTMAILITDSTGILRLSLLFSVALPLLLNPLALILGWTYLLQDHGIINNILLFCGVIQHPLRLLYNLTGVTIGMTYILFPLVCIPVVLLLQSLDDSYILAARNLGACRCQLWRYILFPIARQTIVLASSICFLTASGYFVAPALLGGRRETMFAMLIETRLNLLLDLTGASELATILILMVAGVAVLLMVAGLQVSTARPVKYRRR